MHVCVCVCVCMHVCRSFDEISDPVQQMEKCQELCKCLAEDMLNEKIRVCFFEGYVCGVGMLLYPPL